MRTEDDSLGMKIKNVIECRGKHKLELFIDTRFCHGPHIGPHGLLKHICSPLHQLKRTGFMIGMDDTGPDLYIIAK